MKIPLSELLESVRPLPWPVNGKVEEPGALTFEQLAATRIYRRHAANVLPEVIHALQLLETAQRPHGSMQGIECGCELCEAWLLCKLVLATAETVEVEI